MSFWSYGWAPRKTAAQRRADAARAIAKAGRTGKRMTPVVIEGRKIAHTFWGKAWCDNLERYQDFAYRLDRGRSYVRSGSVIDLTIAAGKVLATVSGSDLYKVAVEIDALAQPAWKALRRDCAARIGSRLDLLGGKLSDSVIERLCADRTGMFPPPSALRFSCSCPDYASMCKHVAAVMYGVGARLDHAPELLFTLRQVSADELHAEALSGVRSAPASSRVLATNGLAAVFGIELAESPLLAAAAATSRSPQPRAPRGRTSKIEKLTASKASRGVMTANVTASKASRGVMTANVTASKTSREPPSAKPSSPSSQRGAAAGARVRQRPASPSPNSPRAARPAVRGRKQAAAAARGRGG